MRRLRSRSLPFYALLLWIMALATAATAGSPAAIPTLSFDNLDKKHLVLPADFHSDRNLLLLYFDLSQQPDVDAWTSVIDGWRAQDPLLAAYTSLVSPPKNFLSRWWQNSSLRSAAPDARHWATTMPIYVEKRAFDRAVGIDSEKQAAVLLLDREGHVLARVSGPPAPSVRATLLGALHAAGSPLAPAGSR